MRKRTIEMKIRFTRAEIDELTEKAKCTGISRESFCRSILTGAVVKEAPPAEVPQLIREIRRVGQNVNQLLLIANNYGERDPVLLQETMKDVQTALSTVIKAYTEEE